jgi:hypothetical protein
MNNKKVIKNRKIIKGGDGYSANPFQPIGGRMSYPRYSNNYRPVFWGELLQNGGHSDSNCGCTKSSSENLPLDAWLHRTSRLNLHPSIHPIHGKPIHGKSVFLRKVPHHPRITPGLLSWNLTGP